MATTGATSPGTGTSGSGSGTAWTSPGNILTNNSSPAICASGASGSNYLVASNFGFSIPTGSTINGITVSVRASEHTAGTEVLYAQIRNDSGTKVGTEKSATVSGTSFASYTYGGGADTWSASPTVTMVNDVDFGVEVQFRTTHEVRVDHITIDITYTPPTVEGAAALTGTGTVSASAGVTFSAASSLSGTGSLTSEGALTLSGEAALGGVGNLTGEGALTLSGEAALSGTGSLTSEGAVTLSAEASLTGYGSLTAEASSLLLGESLLSGAGTMAAEAVLILTGESLLAGVGSLSSEATMVFSAETSLTGFGYLTSEGYVLPAGGASRRRVWISRY